MTKFGRNTGEQNERARAWAKKRPRTAKNAALENAITLAIVRKAESPSSFSFKEGGAVSWRALQFALACEKVESAAERLVLIEFANHADDGGYTYPSIEFIASRCRLDRKTVRRAIASLLVRRMIYGTKKRYGPTGQVKVYRMPKTTYESGCKRDSSKEGVRVPKESHKSPISGCKRDPNLDPDNREPNISDSKALGNSLPAGGNRLPALESKSFSGSYQNHIKFREFASWCEKEKEGGKPTEEGFWTWMRGQKPQWRNKPQPDPKEESGYVLHGKFYTKDAANRLGRENSDLIVKFEPAVRRNGKVLKPAAAAH